MQKFIIDTDAGVDDAVALAMALDAHRRKEIRVLAITCVRGNTAVENVAVNVLRILDRADCKDVRAAPVAVVCRQVHFCHSPPLQIPVFSGASEPLVVPYHEDDEPDYHGRDGFNDVAFDAKPDVSRIQSEGAVDGIRKILTLNSPSEIFEVRGSSARSTKRFIFRRGQPHHAGAAHQRCACLQDGP